MHTDTAKTTIRQFSFIVLYFHRLVLSIRRDPLPRSLLCLFLSRRIPYPRLDREPFLEQEPDWPISALSISRSRNTDLAFLLVSFCPSIRANSPLSETNC